MAAGNSIGAMRASDDDRTQVHSVLNDAYAEGRLTREEWDQRASALAASATYADLDRLTADLPRQYPGLQYGAQVSPAPQAWQAQAWQVQAWQTQRTNGMAIAALVCGLGQLIVGFPAGIAAIILGHKARRRIRMTGEQGDGLAQTGLVLGYLGVGLLLLLALLFAIVAVSAVHHV